MPFIGRGYELDLLEERLKRKSASLVVIYGRRRIGKTALIKEFCRGKKYLRFEGLENGNLEVQIEHFLGELSSQSKKKLIARVKCNRWIDALEILKEEINKKLNVLVFDEFPWMVEKNREHVSLFKYYWDNVLCEKSGLIVIFCGSVSSFMVNDFIRSSSFYGRIDLEISLPPMNLNEIHSFLGKSKNYQDIIEYHMVFGGVPKYLEEIDREKSVIQNINRLCFAKDSFFANEFYRLFKDEFNNIKIYERIVEILSKFHSLSYTEILEQLKIKKGGGYREYINNLERAGFIDAVVPFNKNDDSGLRHFKLMDEYVIFYFHFIKPFMKRIQTNREQDIFLNIVGTKRWNIWTGFAFERFCLKHFDIIEKILKIDQLTKNYGQFFGRKTEKGFQIDLVFDRYDRKISLCEIKYTNKPVGVDIIQEFERKISCLPLARNQEIERVLITLNKPTNSLLAQHYFNKIITIEDFFRFNQ